MIRRAARLGLSFVLVVACGSHPTEGEEAHAPDAELARSAHARIRRAWVPASASSHGGGGVWGSGADVVSAHYEWVLEADALAYPQPIDSARSLAPDEATRFRVEEADDGHMLAFSSDGGLRFTLVALDLGPEWAAFPGVSPELWASSPTTRDLVIQRLRGASPDPDVALGSDPTLGYVRYAQRLLCAQPADGELAAEATDRFVHLSNPGHYRSHAVDRGDVGCLLDAAGRSPGLRAELRGLVVTEPAPNPRALAAWILGQSGTAEDADALAAALIAPPSASVDVPTEGVARLFLAWSIAALAARVGTVGAPAVDALAQIASAAPLVPFASWDEVRVSAIRGLAVLRADPAARAALTSIASEACPLPVRTLVLRFEDPGEASLDAIAHPPACWAAAALALAD